MTAFFPEIDIEKTKANAERKLREYNRYRRLLGVPVEQKVTATYSCHGKNNKVAQTGSQTWSLRRLMLKENLKQSEMPSIELVTRMPSKF